MKKTFKLFIVAALGIMTVTTSSLKAQKTDPAQNPKTDNTLSFEDRNAAIAQIEALLRLQIVNEFIISAYDQKMSKKEIYTRLNNKLQFYNNPVNAEAKSSTNERLANSYKQISTLKSKQGNYVKEIIRGKEGINAQQYEEVKQHSQSIDLQIKNLSKLVPRVNVDKLKANLEFKV